MAFTGYLKIEGIDGESKRADHEGEIDCFGVEFDAKPDEQRLGRLGPHPRPGDAVGFHLPQVVRRGLALSGAGLCQGKSFAEIVFTVRKDSGDAHLDYLIITLENCIISSYKMAQNAPEAASSELISEEIGVSYEKLKIKYVVQADDHSKGDEHEIEYDLVAAK